MARRSLTVDNVPRLPSPSEYEGDVVAWGDALIVALQYKEPIEGFIWYDVATEADNSFENSWAAGAITPEWRLDSAFNVWIRGQVQKATPVNGETIFTLPEGFRPRVAITVEDAAHTIKVTSSGAVSYVSGSGGTVDLSNIAFSADGE